jgi:hypothetical protein
MATNGLIETNSISQAEASGPRTRGRRRKCTVIFDNYIGLRNRHTHSHYLSLGLYTGSDIFDLYDALLDISQNSASRQKFETLLRREVRKTAQYYAHKVEALLEAVQKVLKAGDPVLPRLPPIAANRSGAPTIRKTCPSWRGWLGRPQVQMIVQPRGARPFDLPDKGNQSS